MIIVILDDTDDAAAARSVRLLPVALGDPADYFFWDGEDVSLRNM